MNREIDDDSPITVRDVLSYIKTKSRKIRGTASAKSGVSLSGSSGKEKSVLPQPARAGKLYKKYRGKIVQRSERANRRLVEHIGIFTAVNGFLLIINMVTGSGYPWFLFPLGGLSIFLISHLFIHPRHKRRREELESLPPLADPQVKLLKKLHRKETGFRTGVITAASLSAYLVMINLITSPGFPWSLIASGGLALTVLFQGLFNFRGRRKIKRKFEFSFAPGYTPYSGSESVHESEAKRLKKIILDHMSGSKYDNPVFGEEMKPVLEDYVKRISGLAEREREVTEIIREVSVSRLDEELSLLKSKLDASEDRSLRKEYTHAIGEIEKQKLSCKELIKQKEIINLRLNSGVNVLKRIQLDLVRAKGISDSEEKASIRILKEKGTELSFYLDDIRRGYDEIESDP